MNLNNYNQINLSGINTLLNDVVIDGGTVNNVSFISLYGDQEIVGNLQIDGNLDVKGITNIEGNISLNLQDTNIGTANITNLNATYINASSGNITNINNSTANIQEANIKSIFSSNANIGNLQVFGRFEIENLQLDAFSGSKVLSTRSAHSVLSSGSVQCKDIKTITSTILKDLNVLGNVGISKTLNTSTLNTTKINLIPAGMIMTYVGNTQPEGWLFCRGQFISKSTYTDLYSVLGNVYGEKSTLSFGTTETAPYHSIVEYLIKY